MLLLLFGLQPVKAEQSRDVLRYVEDKDFPVLEQRRFEQCEAIPSPENDAIVGVAVIIWSHHYFCALKTSGKQDCRSQRQGWS
jgi:hypothetical protein